jgi:hypothetical protein
MFWPILEKPEKRKKSAAGAKGLDVVLLFKALILQLLQNLSDEAKEFQIFSDILVSLPCINDFSRLPKVPWTGEEVVTLFLIKVREKPILPT